ncbi:tetratricopeptide repeat protein [Marinicella sp. W31]|uniref:tetratricopeptide repeat protein n=1 Tax=Marinicella sp. W31 TaxID=3023713 RepID=UPI003756555A
MFEEVIVIKEALPLVIAYLSEKKRQKTEYVLEDFRTSLSVNNSELLRKIDASSKTIVSIKALLGENVLFLQEMLDNDQLTHSYLRSLESSQQGLHKKMDMILSKFNNGNKYEEIVRSMFDENDLKYLSEDELLENAKVKIDEYKKYSASKPRILAEEKDNNQFYEYLKNGKISGAKTFLHDVFQQLSSHHIEKRVQIAKLAFHLGELSYYLSDYKQAALYFSKAVELNNEIVYLKKLASIENILGRHTSALQHYQEAKKLLHEKKTSSEIEQANLLNDIGFTQERLGQYHQALQNYLDSNDLTSKCIGTENESYNTTQSNIAHLYTVTGRLNEAAHIYTEIVKNDIKRHGKDHYITAESYNNVGGVLLYAKQYNSALDFFTLSRKIFKKSSKLNSYKVGIITMNIGICLDNLEKFEDAVAEYRDAEKHLTDIFGEIHPDVSRVREQLGYCYYDANFKAEAIIEMEKALNGFQETFGDLHHETVKVRKELQKMYKS